MRSIYAYTAQEYMSENRVKPVRHYSVRKREAREFHGSGLISNHVNFARDVEVSTIATKSIMQSRKQRAKHCIIWICFPSNLSSSYFESDLGQSFFLAKSANSQKWHHTMTVSSLSLPKRKPSQTMQEWIKKPNKYPNYSNHKR